MSKDPVKDFFGKLFGVAQAAPRPLYPPPPARPTRAPGPRGPGIQRQAQRFPVVVSGPIVAGRDPFTLPGTIGAPVVGVTIGGASAADLDFIFSLRFGARGPFPVQMLGQTWEFDPPEMEGVFLVGGPGLNDQVTIEILIAEH